MTIQKESGIDTRQKNRITCNHQLGWKKNVGSWRLGVINTLMGRRHGQKATSGH